MVFYFGMIIFVSLSFGRGILLSNGESECHVKGNCGDCIQSLQCSWCSKIKGEQLPKSGCYDTRQILEVCEENFVENPKSEWTMTVNKSPNDKPGEETIQLTPQNGTLEIRPGDQVTIDIEFKKADNYPIDLYYLMDFSHSMSQYKEKLSALGDKLAETMKKISPNFQIGFGSFVDKVTLPYTGTTPEELESPCGLNKGTLCRSPYAFKNHLSLSKNTTRFRIEVGKAKMSGNLDWPEGVLDALMQAMVCHKEINWRDKARHVLVLSTDGDFHIAGDGKLGGIFEPNDGLCHLDKEGYYTHSLIYDYPSISHVNKKAMDNNVNIIFAVTPKIKNVYEELSKAIHGATMAPLDSAGQIVELVRGQYEEISSKIELTDNARNPIQVKYSVLCPGEKHYRENTKECSGIKGGSTVKFKAHITVTDCPEKHSTEQEIKIKPIGINETLTIYLQTICDCDCSHPDFPQYEKNSPVCGGSGDLVCGKCKCHDGKIGEKCECDDKGYYAHDDSACIAGNSASNLVCSGLGECKCGVCDCKKLKNPNEIISGEFCECDNFSCEKPNGVLCSGNGKCSCKRCNCNPGWSGDSCDCSLDESECTLDGEVCSGKGSCVCGVCHCHNQTDENRYSGKYCQICMTCKEQCDLYNGCVECLINQDESSEKCFNCTGKFFHEFVDDVKAEYENLPSSKFCIAADNSGCKFKYVYYYNESDQLTVLVEREKSCPEEIPLVAIIAGTTGSTVLIGLLILLIWKIVTTYYDKREYEKFERERKLAKWGRGENPLFKPSVTTYHNVAYKKDT